ncbi:MAG TPA: EamA family transporter [Actinotalea sp.]|nr:EamA family transporter [Actinotalea sp.]
MQPAVDPPLVAVPRASSTARQADAGMRSGDYLLVCLAAVLWGTGGLAGVSLAADGLGMLTVATARLAVGGVVLVVVLASLGRLADLGGAPAARRRVLVTGALAALYQSSYFLAVSWTSVSVATLVALGAAPVVVATATAVRDRRRPATPTVVAVALAVLGLTLLVGVPVAGSGWGVALALVAATAFATMTMVNRTPVAGLDGLSLTGASFTLGAALLAPFALAAALAAGAGTPGGPPLLPSGPDAWLLVAYLGLGPTALAYGAYFTGLRTVPATTASLLALIEPLTAALGAALLLGERLGAAGALGAALLVTAVVLLRPRRRVPPGTGLP